MRFKEEPGIDAAINGAQQMLTNDTDSLLGPTFNQYVQHQGERPEEHHFKAFLSMTDRDEVETLTEDFPKRWHVEEFFNTHQALG
jgi:hypothetical protein